MRTSVLVGLVVLCALVGLALAGNSAEKAVKDGATQAVTERIPGLGKKKSTRDDVVAETEPVDDSSASAKKKKKEKTEQPDEEPMQESRPVTVVEEDAVDRPAPKTPKKPKVRVVDEEEDVEAEDDHEVEDDVPVRRSSSACMDAIKEIPDMLGRGMFPWTPDNIPRMNLLRKIPKAVAPSSGAVARPDVLPEEPRSDVPPVRSGARDCSVKSPTTFTEDEVSRRNAYKRQYTTANALNSEMYDATHAFLSHATNLAARAAADIKFIPGFPHVFEFTTKASRLTDRSEFKNELIRHKEVCQLTLNDEGKRQLTDNFEWALQDLALQTLSASGDDSTISWQQRSALFEFFGEWGTHFVDSVVYGGSVIAYEYASDSTVGSEGSANIKLGEDYKLGGRGSRSHLATSRRVEAKVIGGRLDDAKLLSETFKAGAGARGESAKVNHALGHWNTEITMDTAVPVAYHLRSICEVIATSKSRRLQRLSAICRLAHKEFLELEVDHESKLAPMTQIASRIELELDRFYSRGTLRSPTRYNKDIADKLAQAIVSAKCHIHGCLDPTDGVPRHWPALFYIDVLRLQGSVFEVMLQNYQNLIWEAEQVLASEKLGDHARTIDEKRVTTDDVPILSPELTAFGEQYNVNVNRYLNKYSTAKDAKKIPFHNKLEDTYDEL